MKDYRLSEIKSICKKMQEEYGSNACDMCENSHYEAEQFCIHKIEEGCPCEWENIEPRDMIELPSMHKVDWKYSDDIVKYVTYDVIFRDKYGNIQIVHDFTDEERAKQFLRELKNAKSN